MNKTKKQKLTAILQHALHKLNPSILDEAISKKKKKKINSNTLQYNQHSRSRKSKTNLKHN